MRGTRSTLLLLLVFVSLGSYVYFVELNRDPSSETPPNEQLFDWSADDITSLVIESGDQNTEIIRDRTNDNWRVQSPVETTADNSQVSSITAALESLEIRRIVEETSIDLSPYGLNDPSVRIGIIVSAEEEPEPQQLLIGDLTPTGDDRYAKLSDSSRVILVASNLNSTFGKSTFDLRDKAILNFETDDVDRFEITNKKGTVSFAKSFNNWRVSQPWTVRADFSTVQGTVGRLNTGRIRSVVTEGTDETDNTKNMASYGLSDPTLTVTVHLGSTSATLTVGDETENGTYYAKDISRPTVFTIESSLVADMERNPGEYREKNLFEFRPFNASRFEIEESGETTILEKVETPGDGTQEYWAQNGTANNDIEQGTMNDLLAKFSGLRAESFVDSSSDIGLSDKVVFSRIRVTYDSSTSEDNKPKEEEVTLWRTSDLTYGVNGEEPGAALIDTQSVDEAFEVLNALLD